VADDTYQLVVRNAPQSGLAPGQVVSLEGDLLTLGRDPLSDIILDDPEVSRHHARLSLEAGGYAIQDMGSTNGTFVDGKRLTGGPLALKPGQVVMLGSNVTLVYQVIVAVDPLATVVAPAAAAPAPMEEIAEEEVAEEEPVVLEQILEEAEPEIEVALPSVEPLEIEAAEVAEPEEISEEEEEEEEEDFATMMDQSPLMIPEPEVAPEPEPLPDIVPEPEPFPDFAPEPEPLPGLPAEPEPFEALPAFEPEAPPVPEAPAPKFDQFDAPTFIDSAAPVPDFDETPLEPVYEAAPPAPPAPSPAKAGKPKIDLKNNRNVVIIAVVAFLLICCCISIVAGVAIATNGFNF
jgi:pSer/pThr/pTyr-binding forkhead associated (FHA) protein